MNSSSGCLFKIKWTNFLGHKVPYLLQNNDGECPLICFVNVLLLRRRLELSKDLNVISFKSLCSYISSLLPHASPEWVASVLDTLRGGLLFNCKFDSTRAFIDSDPEQLFLSFDIPIKHGWIPDPIVYGPITNLNYDQLLEMLAVFQSEQECSSFGESKLESSLEDSKLDDKTEKNLEDDDKVGNNLENEHEEDSKLDEETKLEQDLKNLKLTNTDEEGKTEPVVEEQLNNVKSEVDEEKVNNTTEEKKEDKGGNKSELDDYVANLAMEFLETYATQITEYGMRVLKEEIPEGSLVALYRNNHFLVATCNKGQLFTLVTDSAFYEHRCVWESLENCEYFDENFQHYVQTSREVKPKKVKFIDKVKRVFRRKQRN
ncbi:uncharacterized protein TA13475 [Theileria annulata]|uniref:MINDY deubiquitinase domain-containing protein n=1 Tax=Theileria annulata TaxID=5874 RepID=Q4UEJ5_THEAN|nr:uncharacterized protein TA13475 [Theileria annulata]CAI74494.1 hypothetical protein, conserved [Theileria annulata]|eukprot:XP_952226.1 hypothetical protein, conserved [Theileria annulata]